MREKRSSFTLSRFHSLTLCLVCSFALLSAQDETVIDGRTGLHVASEDPQDMARALARLIDDPELARRLAVTGRDTALAEFSAQRYQADLMALADALAPPATDPQTAAKGAG